MTTKTIKPSQIVMAALALVSAVILSCQDNIRAPQPDFLNLIPSDSIPFAQLPPTMQQRILTYRRDPAALDIRVISNPFPDALKLFEIRQLRCNMSENRTFYAERIRVNYDRSLSRNDIRWEGKLVGTGVNTGNVSDNIINLYAEPLANGDYTFSGGKLEVSLTERYSIHRAQGYWLLVKYDPTQLSAPSDTVRAR